MASRTEMSRVANGQQVGSGYDCAVVAHRGMVWVYLDAVGREDAWLSCMDDDGEDLQDLAIRVGGQGPGWYSGGDYWDRDSDEWEESYAEFAEARDAALAGRIIRGSDDDKAAFKWACQEQGFTGTWDDWLAMPIEEREEYEAGATGGVCTPKTVLPASD